MDIYSKISIIYYLQTEKKIINNKICISLYLSCMNSINLRSLKINLFMNNNNQKYLDNYINMEFVFAI